MWKSFANVFYNAIYDDIRIWCLKRDGYIKIGYIKITYSRMPRNYEIKYYIEILNYTQDLLVLNCKLNRSKDAFVSIICGKFGYL